ncbi:MAG TPA: hypothetical protein VK783_13595 [Bacteroidia bacterium]|nr:hypothetical protein [Bacteroidia bacterium]
MSLLLLGLKTNAQVYTYTTSTSTPSPTHDVIQSNTGIVTFMQGTGTFASSSALTSFGVNTQKPLELFDVSGGNIDVFTSNKGYKIDTQMVLYRKLITI